jgi:hypothetical protein
MLIKIDINADLLLNDKKQFLVSQFPPVDSNETSDESISGMFLFYMDKFIL